MPGGKAESVEECRLLVVDSVAVLVFEVPDDTAGFPLAIESQRIITHLDDPELAVGPPVEGDRILYQRLGGDQLDLEARRDPDRIQATPRSTCPAARRPSRDR